MNQEQKSATSGKDTVMHDNLRNIYSEDCGLHTFNLWLHQ